MKLEEIVSYLIKLGEHEQYGVALKEWLKSELEKRTDLRKVESWEEVLKKQGVIEFIRKELNMLEEQKGNISKKNDYT